MCPAVLNDEDRRDLAKILLVLALFVMYGTWCSRDGANAATLNTERKMHEQSIKINRREYIFPVVVMDMAYDFAWNVKEERVDVDCNAMGFLLNGTCSLVFCIRVKTIGLRIARGREVEKMNESCLINHRLCRTWFHLELQDTVTYDVHTPFSTFQILRPSYFVLVLESNNTRCTYVIVLLLHR